jgi:hypothetical protein
MLDPAFVPKKGKPSVVMFVGLQRSVCQLHYHLEHMCCLFYSCLPQ